MAFKFNKTTIGKIEKTALTNNKTGIVTQNHAQKFLQCDRKFPLINQESGVIFVRNDPP